MGGPHAGPGVGLPAPSVTAYDRGDIWVKNTGFGFSMPSLISVFFPSNRATFSVARWLEAASAN